MNREQLMQYISEQYCADAEYPWIKFPGHAVFRHHGNRKWFALVMNIPKSKLDPDSDGMIDVLNVKCDPELIGSLREQKGFYPAYHMNKDRWITIVVDGSVEDDKIKWLLGMSYDLTDTKNRRK